MFKRSALALASVVAAACMAIGDGFVSACRYVEASIKTVIFGPTVQAPAEVDKEPTSAPKVALRRAGNFVLRLLKREQPIVTPDWRLVPST